MLCLMFLDVLNVKDKEISVKGVESFNVDFYKNIFLHFKAKFNNSPP